jgi:hypothetical protein
MDLGRLQQKIDNINDIPSNKSDIMAIINVKWLLSNLYLIARNNTEDLGEIMKALREHYDNLRGN